MPSGGRGLFFATTGLVALLLAVPTALADPVGAAAPGAPPAKRAPRPVAPSATAAPTRAATTAAQPGRVVVVRPPAPIPAPWALFARPDPSLARHRTAPRRAAAAPAPTPAPHQRLAEPEMPPPTANSGSAEPETAKPESSRRVAEPETPRPASSQQQPAEPSPVTATPAPAPTPPPTPAPIVESEITGTTEIRSPHQEHGTLHGDDAMTVIVPATLPGAAPPPIPEAMPAPPTAALPEVKSADLPEVKPAVAPEPKPAAAPAPKSAALPEAKPAALPEAKAAALPEAKPATLPETKSAALPEAKPAALPEVKPAALPEANPAAAPETKPAALPETKPTPTLEAKPAAMPEVKPAPTAPVQEATPAPGPEATPAPAAVVDVDPIAEQLRNLASGKFDRIIGNKKEKASIEAFYAARNYAPLWITEGSANARSTAAIAYLGQVDADGLDPADYPVPNFASLSDPAALAEAEIRLTASVVTYAHHAQIGRIHWSRVSADVYYDIKAPEPAEVLTGISEAKDVGEALAAVPLARSLKQRLPSRRLVISTTTATGQALARERMAFADAVFFFPHVTVADSHRADSERAKIGTRAGQRDNANWRPLAAHHFIKCLYGVIVIH